MVLLPQTPLHDLVLVTGPWHDVEMTSDEELDLQTPAIALGAKLRDLRVRANLTVTDLAQICEISTSKLSRMELARVMPAESDVRKIAQVLNLSPALTDDLASQAQLLRRPEPRHPLLNRDSDEQQHIRKFERQATRIVSFELANVPPLLQTAAYMRTMADNLIAAGHLPEAENGGFLVRRMERAAMLMHPRKQFDFVLTWAALATRHANDETMAVQCDHLMNVINTYANVQIGIVPHAEILPYPVSCGFTAYDNRIVVAETFSRYVIIDEPSEVPYFTSFHDSARAIAVYGDEAVAELQSIKDFLYSRTK